MALIKNGFIIKEIPAEMRERAGGKSSINSIRSIYYMLKVVLAVIIAYVKPRQLRKEV